MDNYTSIFVVINALWKEGKKPEFKSYLQASFGSVANPYKLASVCVKLCPDLFKNTSNGMPANIIVELMSFLAKDNCQRYEQHLTEEMQLDMFHLSIKQKNVGLMRLFVKAFQLEKIKMQLLPHIQEMRKHGQLKEVVMLAALLNLQNEFTTEELIVPLFLQDRLSLADEFLLSSPPHQKELLTFIDRIIGKELSVSDLHTAYKIKDSNKIKSSKMLCNTVAKLLKKFNLESSVCPHMQKHRARGALRYIFYKYYIEKGIQMQAFHSLVDDALKESPYLAPDLMNLFDEYHDTSSAVPFVRRLHINPEDIPERIRDAVNQSSDQIDSDSMQDICVEKEECWDDGSLDYYNLSIPLDEVIMITSPEQFMKYIDILGKSAILAIDSEWKPTFGIGAAEQPALLQMATESMVFVLDLVALQPVLKDQHWLSIGQLFSNPNITKLGYGIRGDFKILAKVHKEMQKGLANAKSIIDLDNLKGILIEDYPEVFPHSTSKYKGLTDLVYRCFGVPLDKTDQFSNWAARPLTKSQLRYAALDVVCLIEIYKFLDQRAKELHIENWQNLKAKKDKEPAKKDRTKKRKPNKTEILEKKVVNKEPILAADFQVICDTMVQGLAKKLRCFGIDAEALDTGEDCDECIKYYEKERRIVLTKGSAYERLSKFIPSSFIYRVEGESANDQLAEIVQAFNLKVTVQDVFSRCQKCNSGSYLFVPSRVIDTLKKDAVHMPREDNWVECEGGEINLGTGCTRAGVLVLVSSIPDSVIHRTDTFFVCVKCGKCYWEGGHYERILNGRLSDVVQGSSRELTGDENT